MRRRYARAALTLNPSNGRGYRHLGHALFELELPKDAERACLAAAKLEPKHAPTRYRAAMLLTHQPGRLQEAIEHFNGVLRVDETHTAAKEASEEAQERMHRIRYPKRTDWDFVCNLVPTLVLLFLLAFFFTPDPQPPLGVPLPPQQEARREAR